MTRGRPPLPIGTWGAISTRAAGVGRYRARCKFRDYDGAVRDVVKFGATKNKAEVALKLVLVGRTTGSDKGDLLPSSTVAVLAARWLVDVDDSPLARSTKARYRTLVESFVVPGIDALRLRELTVSAVDRFLKANSDGHGATTAKGTKSVLSGMVGLAMRHDAMPTNPTRDSRKITVDRKQVRALTPVETKELLDAVSTDPYAVELDLPDLVTFMASTGARIGEACALRAAQVDLEHALIEINSTVTDFGLEERPKTDSSWRVSGIPPSAVTVLRRRLADPMLSTEVVMFPSPYGRVRDTSNTAADLRRVFNNAGFEWVSSHTLRKTAATRLDDAGFSARQIADHLGHAQPSMTQDVYLGRRAANPEVAATLDLG